MLTLEQRVELKLAEARTASSVFIKPLEVLQNSSPTRRRQAVVREFYGSTLARVVSNREWAAANDAVTGIVALNEHGCFLTLALDGFHR
jgi:hypothetical protein